MATPTHILSAFNKSNQSRGRIGAGWLQPDGSISISLNPCVTIAQHEDIVIKLFPAKDEDTHERRVVPRQTAVKPYAHHSKKSSAKLDSDSDDVPF